MKMFSNLIELSKSAALYPSRVSVVHSRSSRGLWQIALNSFPLSLILPYSPLLSSSTLMGDFKRGRKRDSFLITHKNNSLSSERLATYTCESIFHGCWMRKIASDRTFHPMTRRVAVADSPSVAKPTLRCFIIIRIRDLPRALKGKRQRDLKGEQRRDRDEWFRRRALILQKISG